MEGGPTNVGLDVHETTVCVAIAGNGRGGEVREVGVFERPGPSSYLLEPNHLEKVQLRAKEEGPLVCCSIRRRAPKQL